MCKVKSAIVLKDRVFMPKYNSHTKMLEELGINDSSRNPNFIRVEVYPESGDVFTDIFTWKYHVDQDYRPSWYVAEYDEQRVREALKEWSENRGYNNQKELSEINVGETFKIGNIEYIIFDKTSDGVSCITLDFINQNKEFDSKNNNFINSGIDKYLNDTYYKELSKLVGEDNIVSHKVDLTSLDGLKDYGECERKISLLTVDQYRKYRTLIPNADGWWWLSTPYSTPSGTSSCYVCCVGSSGGVYFDGCGNDFGVRPFCIFKSSILVSCK